jgi:hypothetical protein
MTLLDRITVKKIGKYKKKGVFTIEQLSYLYKPRRKKQRSKQIFTHNIELQALSIRNHKIYVQQLPAIKRQSVEIFLDIEGNPDIDNYYLIGLLIINAENTIFKTFWADDLTDEANIWQEFTSLIDHYPHCPIYHYGNYETKAIKILGTRYNTHISQFQNRLININQSIYGKIYFPVYSNRLKEIGLYIGANWSANDASGIQALVWRHQWEKTQDEIHKQTLITYNYEDCKALKLLTDKLTSIEESADKLPEIDFAINPKKNSTEKSKQVHNQFDSILKFGHENYDRKKISFNIIKDNETKNTRKSGGQIGHKGAFRKVPKARTFVIVPMKKMCPIHNEKLEKSPGVSASKTITELIFTKNTIRKSVIKYTGDKGYCSKCMANYLPTFLDKIGNQHFGYNFKAWMVYQRLFLRLPYDVIRVNIEELFNETLGQATVLNGIISFAKFFNGENDLNLVSILNSPFIHVDETQVNIKGINQYAWIFTNGIHVYFRLTETRETNMVEEVLSNYTGILISDFYPGFDSLKCKHQKCWVHLIRDINNDLWKFPFDTEYEKFVLELRNLIVPIFESMVKYGSQKRHFNKFKKSINRFYEKVISTKIYHSDITIKYHNRLEKYWDRLFTFTEIDNIPWNNNMAERGLRHLAVQRKISTYFDSGIDVYLLFLGIMQTCRFQKKSFFKFLLSKKPPEDQE